MKKAVKMIPHGSPFSCEQLPAGNQPTNPTGRLIQLSAKEMKKSKFYLCFGAIIFIFLIYALWCGRTFYTKPTVFDRDVIGIPPDVMHVVREWNENQTLFGSPPFEWSHFFWLLRNPRRSETPAISMIMNGGFHYIYHPGIHRYPNVEILRIDEDWEDGHKIFIQHKTLGDIPFADFDCKLHPR